MSIEIPIVSSDQLIAKWAIGQKTICLFRKPTCLAYSLGGSEGQTTTFKPALYSIDYAVNLIQMFHRTIRTNLENEEPHSSCFLPILCREVQNASGKQAALFGRVDASTVARGELKGLRWGIFNTTNKEEQSFPVNDSLTKAFIHQAPGANKPHMEMVLDKLGKPVQKPASDHYAMDSFAKSYCIIIMRDAANEIQSVAMNRVSLLDKNVLLDENNWSVTLVSALDSTRSAVSRIFRGQFGHAMLACEGIKQNKYFLRYIHFTQQPHEQNPNLQKDEAQIVSLERDTPLDTFNGPTWIRSKVAVENMFSFVDSKKGKSIKFILYGSFFATFSVVLPYMFTSDLKNKEELESTYKDPFKEIPKTCLEMAIYLGSYAGILFCGGYVPLQSPIQRIKEIKSLSVEFLPKGFDYTSLGKPLSGPNSDLGKRIADAAVILTPEDCPPNRFADWQSQAFIEFEEKLKRKFIEDMEANEKRLPKFVKNLVDKLVKDTP